VPPVAGIIRGTSVIDAVGTTLFTRKPQGLIHHSDQGSKYNSIAFGNRCREINVRLFMGSVGDAYDNAMAESFFATLECELIARRKWETKTKARLEIFTWIETWYNSHKRHSGLGQMSPINFEKLQQKKKQAATNSALPDTQQPITPSTEVLIVNVEPKKIGI
jgi:putative transposase